MNNGLHVLYMMNEEKFEDIALANVARHYPDSKLERIKPVREERPRGIKAGPNKIKREARRLLEQVGVIPDQYGTTLKTRAQRLFKRPNWSP